MPYLALTLAGYPVDLPPDAQVALSYRVNDVRTLESREAAFSETFTLPLTAQNRAVLGNPHDLASLTTTPYRLLPAVLTSPGGAVLLRGFGIVEGAGDGYEVTLTDAAGALFATVGNRGLRELDLSQYDHALTYANLQAAEGRDYTEGYTYALLDTGVLAGRPQNFDLTPDELPASCFVHSLLLAMLRDPLPPSPLPVGWQPVPNPLAGWRITGSLLSESLYRQLVVPRATAYPQLRAGYVEGYRVKARYAQATVISQTGSGVLQFPELTVGTAGRFTNGYYAPPAHAATVRVQARIPLTHQGSSGFQLGLYDYAPTGNPAPVLLAVVATYQPSSSTVATVATCDITLPVVVLAPGRRLCIAAAIGAGANVTIQPGASVTFTIGPRAWLGAPVHLDAGLPDMSQADLLKLVFNQFNIIQQADPITKTLRFDVANDLERNRNRAVDWTHLLDYSKRPRLTFRLDDYAQTNTLAYGKQAEQVSDELALPVAEETGQGVLLVRDSTLLATREAFSTDLALPLDHLTGFGALPLPWVPFFKQADASKVVMLWDSQHDYSHDDLVIYRGQTWKCLAAVHTTIKSAPLWGDNRYDKTGWDWEATTDAWPVANDTVGTVARLVPYVHADYLNVRVLESDVHGSTYVPGRQLSRLGLPFTELVPAYYPTLAECFERLMLIELDIRLSGWEISQLNFSVPVRIGPVEIPGYGRLNLLGYLNLIDQWQPATVGSVAVQLLVLGAPVPGTASAVPMPAPQKQYRALVDEANEYYIITEDGRYILLES